MLNHWTTDGGSLLIVGRTQTGKTTTAREIHGETPRVSIWVNRRGNERVPGVSGKTYQSLRGIQRGFGRDETTFNLLSSDPRSDIVKLKNWLWNVAERTNRKLPIQIVADEAHHIAPQSQKDSLPHRDAIRAFLKEGRKRNIKTVLITQDPVALDKQSIRQREYLLTYPLSAEQSNYLRDYGIDVSEVNSQPKFSGVLYHANGDRLASGVRAKGKYA